MPLRAFLCLLFLWRFHEGVSVVIPISEDTQPGSVLRNYSCAGKFSFNATGGFKSDFFRLTRSGSTVNLILTRKVNLENESDFPVVSKTDCLSQVKSDNFELIFTCDGTPQSDNIRVTPTDEFEPYFCSKNCSKLESVTVNVPENTTMGTTLIDFNICDKDANADLSPLSIQIHPTTYLTEWNKRELRLNSLLDYESEPKTHNSNATLLKGSQVAHRLNISISVTDSDDFGIAFDKSTFKCFIPENHPVAVTNCSVIARDLDKSLNTDVSYELLSVTPSNTGLFKLLPNGSFSLKSSLDREKESTYYLAVRGFQVDRPQDRMNYTTVLLTVTDVDDNTPEMTETYYSGSVAENSPVGTIVCQVSATDKDEGENSIFGFKIVGNDALFKVDATTGSVTVKASIDREAIKSNTISFMIHALSKKTPTKQSAAANVTVQVLDENDNSPKFEHQHVNISINKTQTLNTKIVQLIANDRDKSRAFNQVSYSIYGGNELGLFSIDTSNGSLFTSKKLDEHFGENITLLIQACDNGNPSLCGYSHLTIQIKNQNIHNPMFLGEPYNVELKERNETVSVLHVYADDKDNDKLEYRVINETKTFTFHGNVLVANSLDAEAFHNTNGVCYVKIQVSDNVHNVSTTVVVSIVDVNDNPPELIATQGNGYTVTVNDITNIGEIILSISAQDSDISNKGFTYILDGGNGDFKINKSTGDLFLANKLGKNGKTYNMSVVVMDHGDLPKSDSALIRVIVADTNPEFHFKQNFMVNMTEGNIQSQTSLAVVSKNGLVSHLDYEISSENKINILKVFRLEQSTGKLTLANASKPLDFEQQSKYEFTIMAKDHGVFQKTAITNVTINVIDVNEKPKIISSEIKVFKEEHTPGNAFISRIQANDPDIRQPFNELSFSISDNVNFKIDENGTITVKANELKAGNYTLVAAVTDGGQRKDALTMQIVVPMIKEILFNVSVDENNTVPYNLNNLNTTIYGIAVTYNILHSTFSGLFKVHNNGSLMLTAVIDREIIDSIEVNVHGRDISSGILLTKIKVVIHVEDINDCSPNFLLGSYSLSIDDLTHNNTVIGTIAAVDNDVKEENRNLTYELVGSGAAGLFTMDRMGNLRIHHSSLLQTKTYDLVIKVYDGQFQSETALKINVIDTNDHSPHFSLTVYSFNITEGQTVGSIVGSVQAQDADSGRNGNFTLSITAGNQNSSFKMNDMSGLVNVKPINREHLDKYQLLLTAQDNGNSPRQGTCTVVINVLDLNDNTPKLGASVYLASILENSKRNASVVVVPDIIASDPDLGMNGSEGFAFKLNDTTSPFCLSRDGSKASVYVCNDIDRELQDTYYLEVAVHDRNGASSSLHSSAPLTIHILDVNDEAPQFTKSVYRFNVSENSGIFMSVGKIVATDKDINENKDIKFGIAKGDDGKFHIDTYSGVISVTGNIDREQKSYYDLYVVAFDGVHKTVAIVTVTVTDVNDNAPLFTMFVIDVAENKTGIIYNTSVYDKDERFTKNSKVSFSVKGRDSQGIEASNFGITADGRLNLTSPLDREKEDHYEVTIIAKDNGVPSLSSSLTLYINVLDVNDNDPVICVDGKCGATEMDIHIKYDTPAMSVVKILDSRDLDLGSSATFHLIKSNIAELFKIEPTTGILRILDPKSLQTTVNLNSSQLFIEVLAMDAGGLTSKTLTLRVHFD